MKSPPRVVIIGAGFGGLAAARGLKDQPVDVVLIDANNYHTFQPLLYQVATAALAPDEIGYPVRGVFRRQRNVTLRMARVTHIDIDRRVVHTSVGRPVDYDTLVVAAGAVSHSFGVEGVAEHAFDLKTMEDAVTLRNHVLRRFEAAATEPALIDAGELNVVICGGGPTGVELAGAFIELFTSVLARDFPDLDIGRSRIVIIEMADRLLGGFSSKSSERARRTLSARGVEIRTGTGVAAVCDREVRLTDGSTIRAGSIVWTAGVRGNPLAQSLGVPLLANGRIIVGPDLAVPGHPEIFAIGDIAADPHSPLAQVALPAIQGGKHVARQICRHMQSRATEPFTFHDLGSMATIGRHDAIAEFPHGIRLAGPPGWIAWLGLHIIRLMGFRNRANVLINWGWNYLTYDRAARLLSEEEPTPPSPPRSP